MNRSGIFGGGTFRVCTYCFARDGHHHLDHDTGEDFQTHLYVKTNAAAVLRRELRTGKTRDQLMPGIGNSPKSTAFSTTATSTPMV
ncbi:hypothetical protein AB0I10_03510 [Streptomyces sp. NPDC050636]|uniref:hypothetical protein n=1 Tax=Streptomyces sp. NPDC050636 TaxID=3154510 RepID=UPI00343AF060